MRIRLEDDGGMTPVRITNRQTGHSLQVVPLEGRKERKARRAARKEVRTIKRESRQRRKIAKAEGKAERREQRQTAKTQRQATRQEKRQRRADVGVQKQEKRMLRVKGRQDVIKARTEKRLARQRGKQDIIQARQDKKIDKLRGARSDNFEPNESDSIPDEMYEETPGGEYMVDQTDYQNNEEGSDYVDTEQYPTESEVEAYETEEVWPEEELNDLGMPWLAPLIKGAGNLVSKISGSKAGQAVSKYSSDQKALQRLRIENVQLQKDLQSKTTTMLLVGGATLLIGGVTGYYISKPKTSKRK